MIQDKVNALITKWDGKPLDVDDFPDYQPYQCFDVWIQYMRDVIPGFQYLTLSPSGYAKDLWENFDGLGLSRWFDKVQGEPQYGDVAVWGNAPFTPDSHVAIFLSRNGPNSINVFEQNAPLPYCAIGYITTNGLLGYLRFKNGGNMGKITSISLYKALIMYGQHYKIDSISDEEAAKHLGDDIEELINRNTDPNTGKGSDWHKDNGILKDLYPAAMNEIKHMPEAAARLAAIKNALEIK